MTPTQTRFTHFINERENARLNYDLFGKKGICNDALIRTYRFCNVNREHDAVTKWVRRNVREPLMSASLHHALFNLAICRVINEPASLRNFLPCMDMNKWARTLKMLMWYSQEAGAAEQKVLRGAYLIVAHGKAGKGTSAVKYYAGAFMDIAMMEFNQCQSMHELSAELEKVMGFSDFLCNQVLTDLRYMDCTKGFPDRMTYVLCGPGTRRGINRWHGRDIKASVPQAKGTSFIQDLRSDLEFLSYFDAEIINHFQDPNNLSNCFCEWDKYERALEEIAKGGKPSPRKI